MAHAPGSGTASRAVSTVRSAPTVVTSDTWSTDPSTQRRATLEEQDAKLQLVRALENMAAVQPPAVFAARYVLLQERVSGGQAVVNFARGASGAGAEQVAIKCDSRARQRTRIKKKESSW
jgi:hypothetical protein